MGYYVQSVKRGFSFIFIILVIILFYLFGPVYKCSDVDKNSEWYVNDIYINMLGYFVYGYVYYIYNRLEWYYEMGYYVG